MADNIASTIKKRAAKKRIREELIACVKTGKQIYIGAKLDEYDIEMKKYWMKEVGNALDSRQLFTTPQKDGDAECESEKEDVQKCTMKEIQALGHRIEKKMDEVVESNRAAVESELSKIFRSLQINNEELKRTKEENRQLNEIVTRLIEVSDSYMMSSSSMT